MDVKMIDIDNIGLSRRSSNALHRAGIKTVGELLEYTEDTLSEIRNMGRKSIDEVLLKIEEYRKYYTEGGLPDSGEITQDFLSEAAEDFGTWCNSDKGKLFIRDWISEKQVKIADLELLSARAYNFLLLNKFNKLDQIIFQ